MDSYTPDDQNNYLKPPNWCPQCIPTDAGWYDPDARELLVCVQNLNTRIGELVAQDGLQDDDGQVIFDATHGAVVFQS
jgi:hypothetical protein